MADRGRPPIDHPAFDVRRLGGMTMFACEYRKDGRRYAITLPGTSAGQVLEDNCADLPGLVILGTSEAEIPADDALAWAVIDAWGSQTKEGE